MSKLKQNISENLQPDFKLDLDVPLTLEADLFALPPDDEPYELPPWNPAEAMALLRHWREDESDATEQRETWEYLKRVLDEDRLSPDRKLFL